MGPQDVKSQAMEKIQYYLAQLDKELSKHPYFKTAEKATGIPKSYLVVGASFCLALLIVFNVFASFLTTLIGFLYPAYASFKAIESKDHKDDTQWLTYWVAFSAFNILEFLSDLILYWIPFYYLFKTAIILWLFLPQFKGAEVLYEKVIRPYLNQHQSSVDAGLNKLKQKASAVADDLIDKAD